MLGPLAPIAIFLAIELLDELVFGVREAAWPAIRRDLHLDYASIGILLAVPGVVSGVFEPFIGLLGNSAKRRFIIFAGGITFALALLLAAGAGSAAVLLLAFGLLYPASGAFVSLSQASLMDLDPASHERNMARWVLAGSIGVVIGPLAFVLATRMGWGWRALFVVLALTTLPLAVHSRRPPQIIDLPTETFRSSARTAWRAIRNLRVIRWLVLLELTDLLGDILTGFLALYFVDVVHVSLTDAALAVVLWSVAGLVGDALLVPLLERASGVAYLRISALLAAVVYPALLLTPGLAPKLILLCVLGVLRAGWYAIPQGRLYSELHGNSGVALAVSNVAGLPAQTFPLILGVLAQGFGLEAALWCCLLAPIALLVGLPRS
ncbi:MAG TPA: MFS transporter [Chloroflexota bacterium]